MKRKTDSCFNQKCRVVLTYYNGNWAQCSLVAESLDVECSALLIDGKPIDHTAKNTIIVCSIPIREESPNGYLYTGEILKYEVEEDTDGTLHLGAKKELGYIYDDGIHMIGYDLSTVDYSKIQTIRFDSAFGFALNNGVTLEIYDHGSNEWIPVFSIRRGFEDLALDVDKMNGIIGENGELFLRIQMKTPMIMAAFICRRSQWKEGTCNDPRREADKKLW